MDGRYCRGRFRPPRKTISLRNHILANVDRKRRAADLFDGRLPTALLT